MKHQKKQRFLMGLLAGFMVLAMLLPIVANIFVR